MVERRIIRVEVDDADAVKKLENIIRLREQASRPIGGSGAAGGAGGGPTTGAAGAAFGPAGFGGGGGGSFSGGTTVRALAPGTSLVRQAEQIVANELGAFRSALYSAGARAAGGHVIGLPGPRIAGLLGPPGSPQALLGGLLGPPQAPAGLLSGPGGGGGFGGGAALAAIAGATGLASVAADARGQAALLAQFQQMRAASLDSPRGPAGLLGPGVAGLLGPGTVRPIRGGSGLAADEPEVIIGARSRTGRRAGASTFAGIPGREDVGGFGPDELPPTDAERIRAFDRAKAAGLEGNILSSAEINRLIREERAERAAAGAGGGALGPGGAGGGRGGGRAGGGGRGGGLGSGARFLGLSVAAFTFQEALSPLRQFGQEAQQAAAQFGPIDPARVAIDQERLAAQARLGTQVERAKRPFDQFGTAAIGALADIPGGGAAVAAGEVLGRAAPAAATVAAVVATAKFAFPGVLAALTGPAAGAIGAIGGLNLAGVALEDKIAASLPEAVRGGFREGFEALTRIGPLGGIGAIQQIRRDVAPFLGGPAGQAVAGPGAGGFIGPVLMTPRDQILARQTIEARRAADPGGAREIAAEQEELGRAREGLSIAQARRSLAINEQQLAINRRQFFEGQAFEREQLGIQGARAAEDIDIGFGRQLRDIDIGRARAGRDIGIRAGDARADIRRSVGQGQREIGISEREGVEDINLGTRRGARDIILGSALSGIGGALIRNEIARRDALADNARRAGRARAGLGRSAGDAFGDVGIGEGRAGRDADQAARDARADADQAARDAHGDLAVGRGRAESDLAARQARERKFLEEQEMINQQILGIQRAEIEQRTKYNNDLSATTVDNINKIKAWTAEIDAAIKEAAQLPRRIREAASGMLEGATT